MAPRGGARQPTRIFAVSESNPDTVLSFDSLSAAAKGLQVAGHSIVRKALMHGEVLNGYKLSPLPESVVPAKVSNIVQSDERQRVFTFMEEVDELFRGSKVRYTSQEPVLVSVYDIIKVITGCSNPHMSYATLQQHYQELISQFRTYQFTGSGERPTPVCTVPQVIELINVLSGVRAARFRSAGAKVLVRFLGGDETLIDEVRENSERMAQLASTSNEENTNSVRMFELPNGMTGANAERSFMLSPSMQGKTVADMRGPCTYLIVFQYQDKPAIKFGWSKDFHKRIKDHHRMYPQMRVWWAIQCTYSEVAEKTETLFKGKMEAYLEQVQLGAKTSTEVLIGVSPEMAEQQMQAAFDTVICENSMNNPLALKELELKKLALELEISKQEVAKQQAETEKLRIMLELHRQGVSVPLP
jgi:hypothetical protein